MKLTIIPSDGSVYIDGSSVSRLSLAGIPENIHALQWKDESGWIEYNDGTQNEPIDSLPVWASDAVQVRLDFDYQASLPPAPTPPTLEDYDAALTAHLDSVAQSRRWQDRISLMSRAGFPGPWQADAIAFGQWADGCNVIGYQILADYQAGNIPQPSVEDVIAALPPMVWPT